jgi:hypothetical protein
LAASPPTLICLPTKTPSPTKSTSSRRLKTFPHCSQRLYTHENDWPSTSRRKSIVVQQDESNQAVMDTARTSRTREGRKLVSRHHEVYHTSNTCSFTARLVKRLNRESLPSWCKTAGKVMGKDRSCRARGSPCKPSSRCVTGCMHSICMHLHLCSAQEQPGGFASW